VTDGVRIAVAGAGLIGRRHVEEVAACRSTRLAAVVDPAPAADAVAEQHGVPRYRSLAEPFERDRPDGVVLATPNQLHVDGGLECVAAGVLSLVEKPVGDTVEAATRLVEAAEAAGVPLLTGHHRRYSPIMARAREVVAGGALGRIVAVGGTALFCEPDDYFDVGGGWRREPGGGPVLLWPSRSSTSPPSSAGRPSPPAAAGTAWRPCRCSPPSSSPHGRGRRSTCRGPGPSGGRPRLGTSPPT
jgi:predicted dehydrogenase